MASPNVPVAAPDSVQTPPRPKALIENPDPKDLRDMVAAMPNATKTEFGNYNLEIKVKARSKASTYMVSDTPEAHSDQTITRAAAAKIADAQNEYISDQTMIAIDGYIGAGESTRTPVRMMVEKANANIAAMQQQLYFTPSDFQGFEPHLRVIYTPNLKADGYPNDRVIAVDLDNGITRVLNSDYFGESKKGGLRMWNKLIYDRGGLPLHAGCKVIPAAGRDKIGLIIGLSGTGKTTTTFTRQNNSRPVQDDFVALLDDGRIIGTENGCFAKTFGLTAETEPMIYHAVTQETAYLENVSIKSSGKSSGKVDFFDSNYTENGRATFPFSLMPDAITTPNLDHVDFILILNRNQDIIPAVAKLHSAQAAAFFMLGETTGTSAGGSEEAGKALRVPGTNPFFPTLHRDQGNRFLELLAQQSAKKPVDVYLMNTGWVGGLRGSETAKKVKIGHSSAIVQGIADDSIKWQKDDLFGYDIATDVPGLKTEDGDLLQPRRYYESGGRSELFGKIADRFKTERREHLQSFPGLSSDIIEAV